MVARRSFYCNRWYCTTVRIPAPVRLSRRFHNGSKWLQELAMHSLLQGLTAAQWIHLAYVCNVLKYTLINFSMDLHYQSYAYAFASVYVMWKNAIDPEPDPQWILLKCNPSYYWEAPQLQWLLCLKGLRITNTTITTISTRQTLSKFRSPWAETDKWKRICNYK